MESNLIVITNGICVSIPVRYVCILDFSHNNSYMIVIFYFLEKKKANNERQDKLDKLDRQLKTEQLLKMQAVNKLAEIMARRENLPANRKPKASASDLRRKEKECRKLQQELTLVSKCAVLTWMMKQSP